jgi:prophage antirepressor-like protein
MNANIQIFNNPNFGEVRVAEMNGEPIFCLPDLCKALDLTNPSSVKSRLDETDVQLIDLHALNYTEGIGNSMANFVNESGFYDVLLQSSSQKVKPFRKWVTSEVLPSIRRHGGYMLTKPEETPEEIMARALILAQRTIEAQKKRAEYEAARAQILEGEKQLLEVENRTLAPKAIYFDDVLQSTSTYTMTQVAKELGMSAYALEKKLHEKGIIFKQSGQWLLYAKYQGKGYTKPRTHKFTRSDGTTGTNTITVFTETGRQFIHSLFSGKECVA